MPSHDTGFSWPYIYGSHRLYIQLFTYEIYEQRSQYLHLNKGCLSCNLSIQHRIGQVNLTSHHIRPQIESRFLHCKKTIIILHKNSMQNTKKIVMKIFTHVTLSKYSDGERGLGPPNQSMRNICSISSLKILNLWFFGQPIYMKHI